MYTIINIKYIYLLTKYVLSRESSSLETIFSILLRTVYSKRHDRIIFDSKCITLNLFLYPQSMFPSYRIIIELFQLIDYLHEGQL